MVGEREREGERKETKSLGRAKTPYLGDQRLSNYM